MTATASLPVDLRLANGLRFAGERLERSEGVALAVRIPAGAKDDPANKFGLANLTQELLLKGTKKKNARKLSAALDYYGLRISTHTGTESTLVQVRCLPEHLSAVLGLLRELISEPAFAPKDVAIAKDVTRQELERIEDDPGGKAWVALKELYFGSAWGHTELGRTESVAELTRADVEGFWRAHYIPAGSTVAVAGKFDPDALAKELETLFVNRGEAWPVEESPAPNCPARLHIQKESQQTQIALLFPSVTQNDPQYFAARMAVGVLSGGMSGRLFTEVREKRALVYSVGANTIALRRRGAVCAYAGTTAPRAKETLEVMRAEFARLGQDCTAEELERARTGVKAHLLMDQESTGARARGLLDDLFFHDRIVPLEELIGQLNAVTVEDVKRHWNAFPHEPCTLVTLGKEALE